MVELPNLHWLMWASKMYLSMQILKVFLKLWGILSNVNSHILQLMMNNAIVNESNVILINLTLSKFMTRVKAIAHH